MVAASAETLGMVLLPKDMGVDAVGEVYADSSAALSITQRQGVGKSGLRPCGSTMSERRAYCRTRMCSAPTTLPTSTRSTSPPRYSSNIC